MRPTPWPAYKQRPMKGYNLAPSFADFGEPRESRTHRENYNTPAAARPFRPGGSPPQHLCSLKWPSHIAAASITVQKPLYCTLKSTLCDSTRDNPNGARSYSDFRNRDFPLPRGARLPPSTAALADFQRGPSGLASPPRERGPVIVPPPCPFSGEVPFRRFIGQQCQHTERFSTR